MGKYDLYVTNMNTRDILYTVDHPCWFREWVIRKDGHKRLIVGPFFARCSFNPYRTNVENRVSS